MKTRRNRNIFSGGVGETDPVQEAQGQVIQQAVPVDPNAQKDAQAVPVDAEAVPIDVDAQIKADAQAGPAVGVTSRTGNANIDDEVAKLTKEEGYYFRAMINAIGICNYTMKMKYNALNPLNPEAFVCGEECHKRADIIRKTIERLIPYLQQSDALGYISSQRVLFNSLGYLGNSAASLSSKAASGLYNAPSAIANAPSAVGKAVYNAPSSIFNAAIKARDNITTSVNAIDKYTRRAFVPQAQVVKGGRRRTRRRR
jgi:hypothetical protein